MNWFQSYLWNRKQYVRLDGIKSQNQSGISQGSTLGPLLFLIYINDLPNSSEKLSFKIFADDTNVFASARDLEHVMNSELAKVSSIGRTELTPFLGRILIKVGRNKLPPMTS